MHLLHILRNVFNEITNNFFIINLPNIKNIDYILIVVLIY